MVSVVIPTHNRCDLLPRAVMSVQKQTYTDLEIIIVSDGSTDNTKSVVESMAKEDPRIKFIEYHPAKGGNIARNIGIEKAAGEYVALLDDDDEWLPEKLAKQMEVMKNDPSVGLVYTGVHILYVNENVEYSSVPKVSGDLSKKILFDNCIGTTSTPLVKKELLSLVGGFDAELKALQDFELWIRICQHTNVGVVPEELINYYNYTGTNQISASTQKYIDSFTYINNKYADLYAKLSVEEAQQKKQNEIFLLINKALRNGNARLARTYAMQSLRQKFSPKACVFYLLSFLNYSTVLKIRSRT